MVVVARPQLSLVCMSASCCGHNGDKVHAIKSRRWRGQAGVRPSTSGYSSSAVAPLVSSLGDCRSAKEASLLICLQERDEEAVGEGVSLTTPRGPRRPTAPVHSAVSPAPSDLENPASLGICTPFAHSALIMSLGPAQLAPVFPLEQS